MQPVLAQWERCRPWTAFATTAAITSICFCTEAGYESFEGSEDPLGKRRKMVEFLEPFTDADVHKLPDVGNKPSYSYILRDHHWEGGDE